MAGNRVDELEAKVQELEATIDGLTDELVETRERLHALEGTDGGTPDILEGRPTRGEAGETATEPPTEDADGEAADEDASSAEADKTDEPDGDDNADSESGDDIIVA
jgi:hypothetical protein